MLPFAHFERGTFVRQLFHLSDQSRVTSIETIGDPKIFFGLPADATTVPCPWLFLRFAAKERPCNSLGASTQVPRVLIGSCLRSVVSNAFILHDKTRIIVCRFVSWY